MNKNERPFVIFLLSVLSLALIAWLIYLTWDFAMSMNKSNLAIVAVFLGWFILFGFPTAIFLAYYFGRTEARGMLSGIDKSMDKVLGTMIDNMGKTVAIRETVHPQPAQPSQNITIIPPPHVSLRSGNPDDIIDA